MTPFRSLTRTMFRVNFNLGRFLGTGPGGSRTKKLLILGAIVYAFAAYAGGFGYLFYMLAQGLAAMPSAPLELLLVYVFLYEVGVAVLIVFFRADAALFRLPDFDILGPLPLKPTAVVFAKTLVMMTGVYLTALIASAPILFAYYSFATVELGAILLAIPVFLATPLIPSILVALIAYGVKLATSRLPHRKAINTILMFAVFLALMVGQFALGASGDNPLLGQIDFIAALDAAFPPLGWFAAAFANGDIVAALGIVLVSVAAFAAFVLLVSRSILRTNSRSRNEPATARRKLPVDYRRASAFRAILAKEWRTFLGVQIYVFNVGFGPIILLLASIASLFFGDDLIAFMSGSAGGVAVPVPYLLLGFLGFVLSMIYTSAISLSIEGGKFWILKSAPIAPATIIDAKMMFNVLLGSIPLAIAVPLFTVAFALPVLDGAAILFMALSFSFLISAAGSIINLKFPRFDFKNEVEIVKQSLGALFGVFGGFGLVVVEGLGLFLLAKVLPWQVAVAILAAATAAAAYGVRALALRIAESHVRKMPA